MNHHLHAAAIALHDAGLAVVPIASDGSKRPAVAWKAYQSERPNREQLDAWFAQGGFEGLGVITGEVSGQLEMLETEGRAVELVPQLAGLFAEHGLGELWTRLCTGWMERSPSGGLHWFYRVAGEARGNTKLARRPGEVAGTVDVLIETRGAGGFVVTAPSGGKAHPSGEAWTVVAGGPATIPTLSVEERDAVYLACAAFDRMPTLDAPPSRPSGPTGNSDELRPGDDYNARTSWDDILVPRGWTKVKALGGAIAWTRPGKHPRDGISATTGRNDGDNLYVFTSSTEFETETPYSKFGAYALLEHGGDHAAAARALRGDGYGAPPQERTVPLTLAPAPAAPSGATDEAPASIDGATVRQLHPEFDERTLAHSDDANAILLVQRFGHLLRYCADRGRWYAWEGTVWQPCSRIAGPAREYAKRIARSLPERGEKDVAHKKKSLSAIGISNMLAQAASHPGITVDYAQLDAHPWELNTPGGIVDLRTGQVAPANPEKLHTRLTLCAPDPTVDRTPWERFLSTTFNGDQDLIGYMQRLVGYSVIGMVGAHVLPYCFGSGGNGKGVFLETCVKVLHDYATTAPAGFLMAKLYQGHETEIARLAGARMVLCSEVNEEDRFDEAKVKQLTGGDTLTARFMQADHFTFTPSHQLWVMGNEKPHVRSGGRSFWRRLRLIPFVHEVPEPEQIDGLQEMLAHEHGPAVLSWIIEGAVAYAQGGLREPSSVMAATHDYQRDQDTVSRFIEEMCAIGGAPHVTTKVGIVRGAYEQFCREIGHPPVSAKAFGMALQRHGVETIRTRSARLYSGLSIIVDEQDEGWQQ